MKEGEEIFVMELDRDPFLLDGNRYILFKHWEDEVRWFCSIYCEVDIKTLKYIIKIKGYPENIKRALELMGVYNFNREDRLIESSNDII